MVPINGGKEPGLVYALIGTLLEGRQLGFPVFFSFPTFLALVPVDWIPLFRRNSTVLFKVSPYFSRSTYWLISFVKRLRPQFCSTWVPLWT